MSSPATEIRRKLRRAAELRNEAQDLIDEAAALELARRDGRWAPTYTLPDLPPGHHLILHTVRDMGRLRNDWSWQVVLHDLHQALSQRSEHLARA